VKVEDGPVPQFTTIQRRHWVGETGRAIKSGVKRTLAEILFELIGEIVWFAFRMLGRVLIGLFEGLSRHW
jgi:hypothetical protein